MKIDHLTVRDWVEVNPAGWQRFGRWIVKPLGRWVFRYRAFSSERVPRYGGFIIAPNHGSYFDAFFFAHGFDRTVRFMAKYQALEWPVIGRLIRWCGGFPVKRGKERVVALEVARAVLASGHGLIMFMEGRMVHDPGLGEPRSGLAMLALQSGVPVVPVAAWGNKPARVYGRSRWRLPRTTVVWGEPLRFPRVADPEFDLVTAVREEIWAEVARLHDVARHLHELPHGRPATFDIPPRPGGGIATVVSGPFARTRTRVQPVFFDQEAVTLTEAPPAPTQSTDDLGGDDGLITQAHRT